MPIIFLTFQSEQKQIRKLRKDKVENEEDVQVILNTIWDKAVKRMSKRRT